MNMVKKAASDDKYSRPYIDLNNTSSDPRG